MRGFLAAMYVGFQIESNWTNKLRWALYLLAYPLGSFLTIMILYGVFGKTSELLPFAFYGNIFYWILTMVFFDMAFSVHDDREHYQTLKYVFLSQTSYRVYLCGRAATRYLMALAAVSVNLCWILPVFKLPLHPHWGLLLAGIVFGYMLAAGLGMCMASLFLVAIKLDVDVVDALFGGMFVLSGALFPPTAFPRVVAVIAEFIPISGWIEYMRRAISGRILSEYLSNLNVSQLFGRAALGAVAVFIAGSLLVAWGSRQAQRKGYIDITTAY